VDAHEPDRAAEPPAGAATTPADADAATGPAAPPRPDRDWATRLVLVLVAVVLLVLAALLTVAFLPRWWAHRVGSVSDGAFGTGVFAGLVCGFVFTALPLLALRRVLGRRGGVTARVVWLLLAALLAAPNLTTLAIVVGTGDGAHAAQRTLDVQAPGFRYATMIGAAAAVVFVAMFWLLLASRRRRTRQVLERDALLADQDAELAHLREQLDRHRRDEQREPPSHEADQTPDEADQTPP
jgi:MFS family permease